MAKVYNIEKCIIIDVKKKYRIPNFIIETFCIIIFLEINHLKKYYLLVLFQIMEILFIFFSFSFFTNLSQLIKRKEKYYIFLLIILLFSKHYFENISK